MFVFRRTLRDPQQLFALKIGLIGSPNFKPFIIQGVATTTSDIQDHPSLYEHSLVRTISYQHLRYIQPRLATNWDRLTNPIAQRSGTGKVKHLDIRELWLQEKVRAKELAARKESTTTKWADLGTESLTGPRISELIQIMPLCRRGVVVACLLCMVNCAAAQPENEDKDTNIFSFVLYMFALRILALYGLFSAVKKRFRKQEVRDKMVQTDQTRADNRTTQTATAQSTASSSTSMPEPAHGGGQRQQPKTKPKPKVAENHKKT